MSFSPHDVNYRYLLTKLLNRGNVKTDRTGTGTSSLFGEQLRFNLNVGFPLLTSKHVPWRLVAAELIWFLKGDTNIGFLHERNCSIWDEWADKDGNLGPIYGKQWRSWQSYDQEKGWPLGHPNQDRYKTIDQIAKVIETLKTNPDSRRMVVSAWNVADLEYMALEPCHCLFQFYVNDGKLSCHLYQRSADIFLGVPFNIASYAMLTHMIAQVTGLGVDQLIISFGDVHLYMNHIKQAEIQLRRGSYDPPTLWLNPDIKNIDDFKVNDVMVLDYNRHPAIKAPVAV